MFEIGQKVKVTDQRPPAIGIIEEVSSTWIAILGFGAQDDTPCYRIRCDDWGDNTYWIGEAYIERED